MSKAHELMIAHHDNLASWIRDGHPPSLEAFLEVHHPDFSLVTASGEIADFDSLLTGLNRSGGSMPGFDIRISDMTSLTDDVHRFLEHHTVEGAVIDVRVTTVVVRDGLVLAVQETSRRERPAPLVGQE